EELHDVRVGQPGHRRLLAFEPLGNAGPIASSVEQLDDHRATGRHVTHTVGRVRRRTSDLDNAVDARDPEIEPATATVSHAADSSTKPGTLTTVARPRGPFASTARSGRRRYRRSSMGRTFRYDLDRRFAAVWAPLLLAPGRQGVTLTDDGRFVARFGLLRV